jgi:hypothetical protein
MSEDNKKQNEPEKKPNEQEAKTELSKQDLDKVAGGIAWGGPTMGTKVESFDIEQ